ncbi:MAG: hypothetical protein B7Z22_15010 [Hyphomonas sp. 32-62-5]|nr:MAG: hypothetical protein B7Z22_15010 [Hyphomonas sp. 32-62-5]
MVFVNKAAFDALDKPTQQAVLKAAAAAEERGWKSSIEKSKWYVEQLKAKGMKVESPSPELRAGFEKIGAQLTADWIKKAGPDGEAALAAFPVNKESARALIAGAAGGEVAAPQTIDFAAWLTSLVPSNPLAAAASNAILPLVIFALFFAFAITRLPEEQRILLVKFFDAVADTMIVIVKWVLLAAPLGVFALALTLGLRGGLGATGALFHYVVLVSAGCIAVALISYPLAAIFGGVAPLRFARAAAEAQVVAFSTQSSIGTLPVMVETARRNLGVPEHVAGLVLHHADARPDDRRRPRRLRRLHFLGRPARPGQLLRLRRPHLLRHGRPDRTSPPPPRRRSHPRHLPHRRQRHRRPRRHHHPQQGRQRHPQNRL